MNDAMLPPLTLDTWRSTRQALHTYSRLMGQVRRALVPPRPRWQHVSLKVTPGGLTTAAMPIPDTTDQTFEMILGLGPEQGGHRLVIHSTRDEHYELPLAGQSPRHYSDAVLAFLSNMGIHAGADQSEFASTAAFSYDPAAAERFAAALNRTQAVLERFKAELPGSTTPVRFWTHNFDLALTWLTGRRVDGVDLSDEERAEEQMVFGFSGGDEGTPEPYYYATAYPWPQDLAHAELPAPAAWHLDGWRGAQLLYSRLSGVDDPDHKLLEFLRAAHRAGASYLRGSR